MNLVLLYHRIASDGWRYSVSRDRFRAQLDVLQSEVETVPLAQAAADGAHGHAGPRVAITFDDGYRDNVTEAWPLLAARGMPATFFIVSGHVGSAREFWWDELEWLLSHADRRTSRLALAIDGVRRTWDLDEEDRSDVYWQLHRLLETQHAGVQRHLLDAIADALGIQLDARRERLPVTTDQVRQLARSDLAEIGAHTVGHVLLPACSLDVQEAEIRQSKRDLEELTGQSVSSFSYPYGRYSRETLAIVADAGFARACKVANTPLGRHHDFAIPRLTPLDWDADVFAARLHGILHADR